MTDPGSRPGEMTSAEQYIAEVKGQQTLGGNAPVWFSGPKNNPVMMTLDQLQQEVLAGNATRNPAYNGIVEALYQGNFISKAQKDQPTSVAAAVAMPFSLYNAYASRLGTEAASYEDWFDWYTSSSKPRQEGGGGYSGPVTTTSVTITDENTAEALLDKYARDLLGRGLTKKETQKYIKDFNKAEAGAPQVTTSAGSGAVRTSTSETATSKEELLREVVSKNPDFAKFQVDTTIMDMLMDDIRKGQEVING
jgi:hypothetical protein